MPIPDLADTDVWPDTDLDALRIAVLTERERRRTMADYPALQAAAQAAMQTAIAKNTAAAQPYDPQAVYQPGAAVSYQGQVWWNPAGVNLHGATPGDAAHPFWSLMPGQDAVVEPWDPATTILVNGNLYSDANGKVWRYLGVTKTAPTGDPNQGPMDNANWQAVA